MDTIRSAAVLAACAFVVALLLVLALPVSANQAGSGGAGTTAYNQPRPAAVHDCGNALNGSPHRAGAPARFCEAAISSRRSSALATATALALLAAGGVYLAGYRLPAPPSRR